MSSGRILRWIPDQRSLRSLVRDDGNEVFGAEHQLAGIHYKLAWRELSAGPERSLRTRRFREEMVRERDLPQGFMPVIDELTARGSRIGQRPLST